MFIDLIQNVETVIVLDAELSNVSFNFIYNLRKERPGKMSLQINNQKCEREVIHYNNIL